MSKDIETTMPPSNTILKQRPLHSKMRWAICALLFWATMAHYVNRTIFGNIAPEMPKYLHLAERVTPAELEQYWAAHSSQMASLLASHSEAGSDIRNCPECQEVARQQISKAYWDKMYWSIQQLFLACYAISSLLLGRLIDVLGLRWGFALACGFWGLASLSQSFAPEIGNLFGNPIYGFFICTFALAMGQGVNFPAVTKTTAEWFPKRERALATGLWITGSNIASMMVPWLMALLVALFSTITIGGIVLGWRGVFVVGFAIDLILVIAWLLLYRNPAEHPRVSEAELAIINSDGVVEPVVKLPWRKLLPHRQTWAFVLGKYMTDGFWWFYLFGVADFFNRKFGLSLNDRKYMIMVIYIFSMVGSIGGGWLAGKLMKRGWGLNKGRKMTLLICALCVVPVAFAPITSYAWVASFLITLAAVGHQGWNANISCLVGDMFPRRVVGSVSGFAGMISAFGGVLFLFIVGKIVSLTGSYFWIFIMASAAYLLALVVVHLLAPKLDPAKIDITEVAS